MPDVILVHPLEYTKNIFVKSKEKRSVPIAIWYLGSYLLSKGVNVVLIDFETDARALEKLEYLSKDSLLVGITMMTAQVGHGLRLAQFVKNKAGNVSVVVGGVHPTLYPEETVRTEYIDFAIHGEGEIALFELYESIKAGKNNFSDIERLIYKEKGQIFFNKEKTRLVDHFNYPDLDYKLLDERLIGPGNSIPLVTSRGCPYDCSFCCNNVIQERRAFRSWSLQKIIHEIKKAVSVGITDVFMWDDNFFQKKDKVVGFLDEIKKIDKKFTWFGNARADYFNEKYLSVELLSELNKYGLTRMSIGAESGSQKMLDYMRKRIKVEHILNSARYCVKANIEPSFSFMVGLPKEDEEDIRLTVECVRKLCDILPLPKILGPMLYLPLPGSEMFNNCVSAGYNPPKTIEEWADIDSGYGFSAYDRPWIKSPEMVRIVWFYSILITSSYAKIIRIIRKYSEIVRYPKVKELLFISFALMGSAIGKARYKFNFFKLPVETIIFKSLRNLNAG